VKLLDTIQDFILSLWYQGRFKSYCIWHFVSLYIVPDILEKLAVSMFWLCTIKKGCSS